MALSLSDSFCVDRHRESFLELVKGHVDILFANEAEVKSLYQTDSFEAAAELARAHTSLAVLTRGARGSVLLSRTEQVEIAAEPLERVVDTHWTPPVTASARLVSIVDDAAQHLGQAAYVRGIAR